MGFGTLPPIRSETTAAVCARQPGNEEYFPNQTLRDCPVHSQSRLLHIGFAGQACSCYHTEATPTGCLISPLSNSPENGGLVAGLTTDQQIIRHVFANVIASAERLGVDDEFRRQTIPVTQGVGGTG